MEGIPAALWAAVADNVVAQWFLVIVFILLVGTNTATKLKGPLGGFARWMRSVGEARENKEAQERRETRKKLLQSAQEGREYVEHEMAELHRKVNTLLLEREALGELVDRHLGWDYDRRKQLIDLGVPLDEIPAAPPLRVIQGHTGRHRISEPMDDDSLT